MVETIALAFLVAKIKKFKLLPIFKDWAIYPVLIMATLYIYLESTIWHGDYSFVKYSPYFKATYLGCFVLLAFKNNQIKALFYGLPLVWLGYGLNYIAVKANGGKMPVFVSNSWATGYAKPEMFINSASFGDFHVLGNINTKLIPICDTWDFGWAVVSIGDILIRLCVFIIVYNSIKYKINKKG